MRTIRGSARSAQAGCLKHLESAWIGGGAPPLLSLLTDLLPDCPPPFSFHLQSCSCTTQLRPPPLILMGGHSCSLVVSLQEAGVSERRPPAPDSNSHCSTSVQPLGTETWWCAPSPLLRDADHGNFTRGVAVPLSYAPAASWESPLRGRGRGLAPQKGACWPNRGAGHPKGCLLTQ
jgi:hypothetical protein